MLQWISSLKLASMWKELLPASVSLCLQSLSLFLELSFSPKQLLFSCLNSRSQSDCDLLPALFPHSHSPSILAHSYMGCYNSVLFYITTQIQDYPSTSFPPKSPFHSHTELPTYMHTLTQHPKKNGRNIKVDFSNTIRQKLP